MDIKKDLNRLRASLIAANAIRRGTRTMIRLGGESMKVTYNSDMSNPNNDSYTVTVSRIEFVSSNLYKKKFYVYEIPASLVKSGSFNMYDMETVYGQYLVQYTETYVDKKNNIISGDLGDKQIG